MSYVDLQATLRDWPYEPDKISVRKILGADGATKLQMRVELGILQLEGEGRPDGARPKGCETLLAYHQQQLARQEERNGNALGSSLTSDECHNLRGEASLFYRRYIAYFVLEEYRNVYRDTAHSLAIFDLCREHAIDAEDRMALEEFRAYVLMMDARARVYEAMGEDQSASALAHVNRGILSLKSHFKRIEQPELVGTSEEMKILRNLYTELNGQVPQDSVIVTRKALQIAIDEERFEEAARLRDQLENLRVDDEGAAETA